MSTKALILEKAAELLADSTTGDISTRAVCEAAGVTQPVLYRHFGDKDGLLAAVADAVWGEYLTMKRRAEASDDALADLREGWDNHTAFALAHPHAYRLVFASSLSTRPVAMDEAMRMLRGILQRLAEAGRLRMAPEAAAGVVMAANSGVALGMILRPEQHGPTASADVRDAVLAALVTDAASTASPVAAAATTLAAHLDTDAAAFTPAERGLFAEWLQRLA